MRDRETIDSELKALAASRRSIRKQGHDPSSRQIDALLDERLGHRPEAFEPDAVKASQSKRAANARPQRGRTHDVTRHRHKGALRRLGLLAALPLSALAVAAMLVTTFSVHDPDSTGQPTLTPPSEARPNPATPEPPAPVKPQAPPPLDIVDRAFIDVLKHDGVPVPDNEYAMSHGHAVCDFLTRRSDFAEAVRSVQQSSIWDANQSADFAAGAVVSYCPQHRPASPEETQQPFQDALANLQAIEGDLQGIRDDLQAIAGQP